MLLKLVQKKHRISGVYIKLIRNWGYKDRTVKNLIKRAKELGYLLVKKDELVQGVS